MFHFFHVYFEKRRAKYRPVFIIVVWEIPIWLLVLAGLCVLGVSAYEYIPIICAIVTFLIALVSISVSASSALEKRNVIQLIGFKKVSRWISTIVVSFLVSLMMFFGMQRYVQRASEDIIGKAFSFIEMGVNNIPVFIGISILCCVAGKSIGDDLVLKNPQKDIIYSSQKKEEPQESNQGKQKVKNFLLMVLAVLVVMICISIGW